MNRRRAIKKIFVSKCAFQTLPPKGVSKLDAALHYFEYFALLLTPRSLVSCKSSVKRCS